MASRRIWTATAAAALAAAAGVAALPASASVTYVDAPDGSPGPVLGAGGPQSAAKAAARRWSPNVSGQQDRAVLLCTFNGGGARQANRTPAYYQQLFGSGTFADTSAFPQTLRAYFAEVSYGAINFVPVVTAAWEQIGTEASYGVPFPSNNPSQAGLDAIAQDCINTHEDDVNFGGVEGVDVIVPTTGLGASGIGGERTLVVEGVSRMMRITWIPTLPQPSTNVEDRGLFAHEIGHSFGLPHVTNGVTTTNGTLTGEVGGYWDPMGFPVGYCFFSGAGARDGDFGCSGPHYSGAFRSSDFLGWIPANRQLEVSATGEIVVPPPPPPGGGTTTPGTTPAATTPAAKRCKKKAKKRAAAAAKKKCAKKKGRSAAAAGARRAYPTTTVTVEQSAQPPNNSNPIYVKVRRDHQQSFFNDYFGIEVRNKVGQFDGKLAKDGVMISHVRPDPAPDFGNQLAQWPVYFDAYSGPGSPPGNPGFADVDSVYLPGETFTSADGLITIEVLADTGTGYSVRITNRES